MEVNLFKGQGTATEIEVPVYDVTKCYMHGSVISFGTGLFRRHDPLNQHIYRPDGAFNEARWIKIGEKRNA
ncbi:hypothetical protein [Vibrio phage vB_VmeM-Yong XC32]|nr:hypothetical protein [Vibrio phage vB_VmeM-Yong XC31]QAX96532.1 hypothetical protein [Vibrio phage vB_VmeM-Yong XC32]QAX96850.1 hypothetical protein [Vibrio phage vB_VmeM-Yong MS31]QAX97155.1 hypothetical protein [Vibrio phage vB_VmeM-Yong MS32]